MSKTSDFTYTGEMFTASVQPWQELPFHLCFANGAKLTLNPDGSATFEGDADEAAQMFFDSVIRLHNRQYQALEVAEKRIAELEARTTITATWINDCDKTVPAALRYLAENPRPIGSNSNYNTEHLYDLAHEIEATAGTTKGE